MEQESQSHRLTLQQRRSLTVTGVEEVVSFDETAVVLHTALGTLVVQGKELQMKALSPENGQMAVEGTVSLLAYEEPRRRGGWVQRLFG